MGILREWFGPSKDEVWQELCRQGRKEFVPGGWWKDSVVRAQVGDWTVTLDTFTVNANNTHTPYTRLRAPYVNPDGFRFHVYRKSLFTGLGKLFGMQDVEIGRRAFDEAFVIQGNDEHRLRKLFDSARIRELLERQPDVSFRVTDDEGWFGAKFPDGVDELRFAVVGVIKDVERLEALFDLFAETLDRLCEIGSAYRDDPGVTL